MKPLILIVALASFVGVVVAQSPIQVAAKPTAKPLPAGYTNQIAYIEKRRAELVQKEQAFKAKQHAYSQEVFLRKRSGQPINPAEVRSQSAAFTATQENFRKQYAALELEKLKLRQLYRIE